MSTFETVLLIVHTLIAILLIVLVLLQRGKGADAGAAFGAGASGTVFGARGSASFFSRATAVLATAFFVSSLALAYLTSQDADRPQSLIEGAPAVQEEPAQKTTPQNAEKTDDSAESPALPDLPTSSEDTPAESGDEPVLPELAPSPSTDDDEEP